MNADNNRRLRHVLLGALVMSALAGSGLSTDTLANELRPAAAYPVTGFVRDPVGNPISGIWVSLNRTVQDRFSIPATTAGDGSFSFASVPPGVWRIQAVAATEVFTLGLSPYSLTLTSTSPGGIYGTVSRSTDGSPWSGGSVSVINTTTGTEYPALTSSGGVFSSTQLPAGDYVIAFWKKSSDSPWPTPLQYFGQEWSILNAQRITVSAGQVTTITPAVMPGATLEGTLIADVAPPFSNGSVTACYVDPHIYGAPTLGRPTLTQCQLTPVDGANHFVRGGLPPGAVSVSASFASGVGKGGGSVTAQLTNGLTTTVNLEAFLNKVLVGRVTDKQTGQPISNLALTLFNGDSRIQVWTNTDAGGNYSFDLCCGSPYYLSSYASGFYAQYSAPGALPGAAPIMVGASPRVTVNLALDPLVSSGAGLSGIVRDATGALPPIANATVTLMRVARPFLPDRTTTTNVAGEYSFANPGFPDLVVGDYRLRITHPSFEDTYYNGVGSQSQAATITLGLNGMQSLDVLLYPTSQVTGSIARKLTGESQYYSDFVYFTTADGQTVSPKFTIFDMNGFVSYTVTGLHSGAYYFNFGPAKSAQLRNARVPFTVTRSAATSIPPILLDEDVCDDMNEPDNLPILAIPITPTAQAQRIRLCSDWDRDWRTLTVTQAGLYALKAFDFSDNAAAFVSVVRQPAAGPLASVGSKRFGGKFTFSQLEDWVVWLEPGQYWIAIEQGYLNYSTAYGYEASTTSQADFKFRIEARAFTQAFLPSTRR